MEHYSKRKQILLASANVCPFCRAEGTQSPYGVGGSLGRLYQDCSCPDCGAKWREVYRLTNVVKK